jgi:hypothetical protein
VVLSTVLTAALMVGLTFLGWGWGWSVALVFGALISAADPVAVVAILRELGVSGRTKVSPEVSHFEKRLAKRIELNLEREGYEDLARRGIVDEASAERELHDVNRRMHLLNRSAERVPIPKTAELVASTPWFSSLDADALKELAELTEEMVVPAGEHCSRRTTGETACSSSRVAPSAFSRSSKALRWWSTCWAEG